MIKTFRGLLADGAQERIRLSTIQGKVGYKIIKFQLMGNDPGIDGGESSVKIYKTKQTSITSAIDFTDSDLLAAGFWSNHNTATNYTEDVNIIFDTEIINQDIYITHLESNSTTPCNYYIELEVVPLTEQGAEYTTIKDLRANA